MLEILGKRGGPRADYRASLREPVEVDPEPNVGAPCRVRDADTGEVKMITVRYAGDLAA